MALILRDRKIISICPLCVYTHIDMDHFPENWLSYVTCLSKINSSIVVFVFM